MISTPLSLLVNALVEKDIAAFKAAGVCEQTPERQAEWHNEMADLAIKTMNDYAAAGLTPVFDYLCENAAILEMDCYTSGMFFVMKSGHGSFYMKEPGYNTFVISEPFTDMTDYKSTDYVLDNEIILNALKAL